MTLPRFMLEGAAKYAAEEPVPDKAKVAMFECTMFLPPHEAPYVMLKLPLTLPAVRGANETDKFALCWGATAMGRLGPEKLNPVPETVACEIVTVCLPVLVTATGLIKLLPTCTVPNETFVTEIDIWAAAAAEISTSEMKIKTRQAGLRGEPRHLMNRSLFCTCSLSTAGDL